MMRLQEKGQENVASTTAKAGQLPTSNHRGSCSLDQSATGTKDDLLLMSNWHQCHRLKAHSTSHTTILLCGVNLWVRVWLRAAQTVAANTCGSATKKRNISRSSLPINLHLSVLRSVSGPEKDMSVFKIYAAARPPPLV